jgi:hypothetical protein
MKFYAQSEKLKTKHYFYAKNFVEARHWVVNHLDLSGDWFINKAKKQRSERR